MRGANTSSGRNIKVDKRFLALVVLAGLMVLVVAIPYVQPMSFAQVKSYAKSIPAARKVHALFFDFINQYTTLQNVTHDDIDKAIQAARNDPTLSAAPRLPATGPLRYNPENPRYFTDESGRAIYLSGSHTWLNLQDGILTDPPLAFDYTTWLDFLEAHNHNFFRLWRWEQAKWSVEWSTPYYFSPLPYQRTGPGNGLDGKPKFDLTKFDQSYFDRLRQRVIEAGERGIYVSVMLFDGWSVEYPKGTAQDAQPWLGHPYNIHNNINGIDGDPNGDNSGIESHSLLNPAITALQEAYVRKVIESVNDLDNVLYEISNESHTDSEEWQYHMIDFIHQEEASRPKQHPVGMTLEFPIGSTEELLASNADWISPGGSLEDAPPTDGNKVIVYDTDHICGICGDRAWVWMSFTRGYNLLFMDQFDDSYKLRGGGYELNNANDTSLRRNLGYTLAYANRMNLVAMSPHGEVTSTGYCLANPTSEDAEYLIYQPNSGAFTVDLSATSGELHVEWLDPATGATTVGQSIAGGESRTFTPPFEGDAVLYLY